MEWERKGWSSKGRPLFDIKRYDTPPMDGRVILRLVYRKGTPSVQKSLKRKTHCNLHIDIIFNYYYNIFICFFLDFWRRNKGVHGIRKRVLIPPNRGVFCI